MRVYIDMKDLQSYYHKEMLGLNLGVDIFL